MNIPSSIVAIAKEFQVVNNLDIVDIEHLLLHDFIHATLGLGVTTAEEELVEYVENHLTHGISWNEEGNKLAASLPVELRNLYKFGNV